MRDRKTLNKFRIAAVRGKGGFAGQPSTLLNGLVAGWKMDEASDGSVAVTRADCVGTNHLTDINTTASGAGLIGNCALLVGSDGNRLERESDAELQIGDHDFTFAVWIYLTENYDGGSVGKSSEYQFVTSSHPDRALVFLAGGTFISSDFGLFNHGEWALVIGWYNSATNQIGIQVNNSPEKLKDEVSTPAATANDFKVGPTASGRTMAIDDVYLWKRLLTTAEKTELYNLGGGKTHPFL